MPDEKTINLTKQTLIDLGLSTEDSIVLYSQKVRDRDDVSVLKCEKSGVIFMSRTDHINPEHYGEKNDFCYWGAEDRNAALTFLAEDTDRRLRDLKYAIANKKWLDIGTGAGGTLDALSPVARKTAAVEPQEGARKQLQSLGYAVYPKVEDVVENDFDIATLFNVLEHIIDPVSLLKSIKSKMAQGGKIIVEVPHAGDILLSLFNNEAFKTYTLWSEHIMLHTRESLTAFLRAAGFSNIVVGGLQRHPLANHLHWLARGKPYGHHIWHYLRTSEIDRAYADLLSNIDKTDTLIATAEYVSK